MISAFKKMNFENFSSSWKSRDVGAEKNVSCEKCSVRFNVFRRKKICVFCKNSFCQFCIMRQEDKKFCCRKCQILTARPLNKSELLNLRSRDLVNYLTSRHISTNGCVEKEDLVNVLIKAVNNSCFHPASTSTPTEGASCTNSYPNSPKSHLNSYDETCTKKKFSQSEENLFNGDGIRITGHNVAVDDSNVEQFHENRASENLTEEVREPELNSHSSQLETDRLPTSEPKDEIVPEINMNEEEERATQADDSNNTVNSKVETNTPFFKPLMLSDIKNCSDLESLNIKQLKELLTRNRTDFKGCIERTELLQKAKQLWSDYKISRKDIANLSLDELCKICMDAPIECVLLECGHMATCTTCGKQLCECPICRQFVVRCVRTYRA